MTKPPPRFDPGPDPGLDDVLSVDVTRGIVHRGWTCGQMPPRRHYERWTPENSGLDDRACGACLPEGLQTR